MTDFQSGSLRYIGSEFAGAGDGDVAEAGVEQIRVDAGIGVDENAFGGQALGAVTGDGVAVVEMTMLAGSFRFLFRPKMVY